MLQGLFYIDSSLRAEREAFFQEIYGLMMDQRRFKALRASQVARTRGFAVGNKELNGFFFRNGRARMYSRDLEEVMA